MFGNNQDAYYSKNANKWWDGYSPTMNMVLLDDLGKEGEMLGSYIKRWTDRYPFNAEVKGSSIVIRPELIVITSNFWPHDIWGDANTLLPILRRIQIITFGDEVERPRYEAGFMNETLFKGTLQDGLHPVFVAWMQHREAPAAAAPAVRAAPGPQQPVAALAGYDSDADTLALDEEEAEEASQD